MIQDIAPSELSNEFKAHDRLKPDGGSFLIVLCENGIFSKLEDGLLTVPSVCDGGYDLTAPEEELRGELRYLIAVDGHRFYAPSDGRGLCERLSEKGFRPVNITELRYASPPWLRFGALAAWQAARWYRDNAFCGRCGNRMTHSKEERSLVCASCGSTIYPRLCPVVIVGVTNGDHILLTKYAGSGAYRNFALVAGFAEIGETIEETVRREVMEETGLRVKNLRYYKSQPWPYSDSLLFGFFCDVDGDDAVNVNHDELSTAVWTRREDVPDDLAGVSLTHEMMTVFKKGMERQCPPDALSVRK